MLNEHLLRIAGMRPLKSLSKKEKQDREHSWNPRFYIERMPVYDASKDKYLQGLVSTLKTRKVLIPTTKIRKVKIRSPKNIQKVDSTKKLPQTKPKVLSTQIINKLKANIESAYAEKKIPAELSQILFESMSSLDPRIQVQYMSKTLNELYDEKNVVQYTIKAVIARENWIEQLLNIENSAEISKSECSDIINNLRILSIHAVECIQNWRNELSENDPNKLKQPFMWKGENYLIKMTKDLDFLKNSVFAAQLGEEIFNTFIPNFVEKPNKMYAKRLLECEARLNEETLPSVRQTPFEMRSKFKKNFNENSNEQQLFSELSKKNQGNKENHGKSEEKKTENYEWKNENAKKNSESMKNLSEKSEKDQKLFENSAETKDNMTESKSNHEIHSKTTEKSHALENPEKEIEENQKVAEKMNAKSPILLEKSQNNDSLFETLEENKVDLITPEVSVVESQDLKIEPIIGDLKLELENFSHQVPHQIKACLGDPQSVYSLAFSLKYPAFFWVKSTSGKCIGLFTLNMDYQKTVQTRLYISHISSNSLKNLEKVIQIAVNYASTQYPCDEIRVSLFSPSNSEGKYVSDKEIKQFFSALGFRWKKLIKEENSTPIELMGLVCDKSAQKDQKNSEIFTDNIQISYYCTSQTTKADITPEKFLSAIGVASAFNALLGKNVKNATLQKILEKVENQWTPPAFKLKKEKSAENIIPDIKKLNLPSPKLRDSKTSVSISSIELNWNKFLTTEYNGYKYTVILNEISVMRSGKNKVFIIPTEDQNFNVFLIQYREKKEENKEDFETAHRILAGIKSVDKVIGEIWVPEFVNKLTSSCVLEAEHAEKVECKEFVSVSVKAGMHNIGNIRINPNENSTVITKGFFFGLMHSKIDEIHEIPYVALYVNPETFTRCS